MTNTPFLLLVLLIEHSALCFHVPLFAHPPGGLAWRSRGDLTRIRDGRGGGRRDLILAMSISADAERVNDANEGRIIICGGKIEPYVIIPGGGQL